MTIPTVDSFTVVPSRSDSPDTFADDADTFVAQLSGSFLTQINATVAAIDSAASEVDTDETAAASSASSAATQATTATTQAGIATTQAAAAAASAVSALNAPGSSGTSATSLTIGAGAQSITTQSGKAWVVGQPVIIARTSAPSTTWMAGVITSYSGTSLGVTTVAGWTNGSGTFTDWTIGLTAPTPASIAWSLLTGVPTTIAGYGITNAAKNSDVVAHVLATAGSLALNDLTTYASYGGLLVTAPTNAASVPDPMTTSDGWSVVTGFVAGTLKSLYASSMATAHGVWRGQTMTPPTFSTLTGSFAPTVLGTVMIDTNIAIVHYLANSIYNVVAVNTSTGTWGTPQALTGTPSGNTGWIFKTATDQFVAVSSISSAASVQAGSVNTGTLDITLGTAANTVGTVLEAPISLTATLYVAHCSNATDVQAISISGTVVTIGTAVTSGATTVTAAGWVRLVRSSNTEILIVYLAAGSSGSRQMTARIGSISGTTITLQTAAASASNVNANAGLRAALAYSEGASFIAVAQDGTVGTTGNWFGITVSGTVVTMGAVNAQTLTLPAAYAKDTWIYQPPNTLLKYNSTTMMFGKSGNCLAITISGTTLTVGAYNTTPAGSATFAVDSATGATFYLVANSTYTLSISGTTFTLTSLGTGRATIVQSNTINDKFAVYSAATYPWTLTAPATAMGATYWLYVSGNNLLLSGPIT